MKCGTYLRIDGIPGDGKDPGHLDWMPTLSFHFGIVRIPALRSRCEHSGFSVVKYMDRSSPHLALACCDGRQLKEVELHLCIGEAERPVFMAVRMEGAVVQAYRPGGGGNCELPLEEVSFTYRKIEWRYYPSAFEKGREKDPVEIKTSWTLEESPAEAHRPEQGG